MMQSIQNNNQMHMHSTHDHYSYRDQSTVPAAAAATAADEVDLTLAPESPPQSSTSNTTTAVTPEAAVLSLLSLGQTAPASSSNAVAAAVGSTSTASASPSSPTTPSSSSLTKRSASRGFNFSQEQEYHSGNLPPRESTMKINMNSSVARTPSLRTSSFPATSPHAPIPPSLALALQTAQSSSQQQPQQCPTSSPPSLQSEQNRSHLSPLTPSLKSPPRRKIVPVLVQADGTEVPTTSPIRTSFNSQGPARTDSAESGLELTQPTNSASAASSSDLIARSASAPISSASLLPTPTLIAEPLSVTVHQALKVQLLRAHSSISHNPKNASPACLAAMLNQTKAELAASSRSSTTTILSRSSSRPPPGSQQHQLLKSSISGSSTAVSGNFKCGNRIRLCIKPIDQIKTHASHLLDEARHNKKAIRTYQFP